MKLVNGKLVMGKKDCRCCNQGQTAASITCNNCNGTGKGKRGKVKGCKNCFGNGQKFSWDHPVTCSTCNGNYQGFDTENLYDSVPEELWNGLQFKVYRHNRPLTGNESLLGFGCVFSCTDYGDAWKEHDDDKVIANVKKHTYHQAVKLARDDYTVCSHVGIFVAPGGYSVRAVFDDDVAEVEREIAAERPYKEYMAVGTAIAEAGGNGTFGALYRKS
mgnify:CR=1 FL=1